MAAKTRKWVLIAGGAIILVIVVGMISAVLSPSSSKPAADLREQILVDGGDAKVALVAIEGEILPGSSAGGEREGAALVIDMLERAAEDDAVKAVILDINTPGGAVVASDDIYRKVLAVKRRQKPVVALMGEVAASGGYYVAAAADEILANSATITGSIGVIMFAPNLQGAAGKLGVDPVVIKSGQFKDVGSPFKEMTPEDRAILQALIDEAYGKFVGIVAAGRKLPEARVRELADGRVYTGAQAMALGLVDSLGGRDEALARARSLGRAPDATLVAYVKPRGFLGSALGLKLPLGEPKLLPPGFDILRPGLKYLWLP